MDHRVNPTIPGVENDIPYPVLREMLEHSIGVERQSIALGHKGPQELQFPLQSTGLRTKAINTAIEDAEKALRMLRQLGQAAVARLTFLNTQREEQMSTWTAEGLTERVTSDAFYLPQIRTLASRSLIELDDSIQSTENQISFLASQEQELVIAIDQLRALHPQSLLPIEIWQTIFLTTIEQYNAGTPVRHCYDQTFALSRVCRSWLRMILGHPTLFSIVNLFQKTTRDVAAAMEWYMNRFGQSESMSIYLPKEPIRAELSAYSAEFNTLVYAKPMATVELDGQDSAHAMHNASKVKSLTLSSSGLLPCSVVLKTWHLQGLYCINVIPILTPSAAQSITKLSIVNNLCLWQNDKMTRILAIIPGLVDLTIARFGSDGDARGQIFVPPSFQNQLRRLRITPEEFNSAGDTLCISPYLHHLGIYVSDGHIRANSANLISLNQVPRLQHSITHLELCAHQGPQCLGTETIFQLLQQSQRLRVLQFTGTGFTLLVNALAHTNALVLHLNEVVFRNCDVAGAVMVEFLTCKAVTSNPETGSIPIQRVVLDQCTGITKSHCDLMANLVSKLVVY